MIPALGFGVFQTPPEETIESVETALRTGYRGITFYREGQGGSTLEDATIANIATVHDKTPAQVMLRWHLQQGRSAIPKSTRPQRIAENFDVFDFELAESELAAIDSLDRGLRRGPEPSAITLETFGREIPEA